MTNRTIFFVTGARSDYDLMLPVIKAVQRTRGLKAGLVVTAAHLSPFHGYGLSQVARDGIPVVGRIESLLSSESWTGRGLSFAQLTEALIRLLDSRRPDLLFVAGDREEALAGALAANFARIPAAHLHGGDRAMVADLDEVLRPAISKLAHLHFPAIEEHRRRLIRMGEDPKRVWTCGAPGLDLLRAEPDLGDARLRRLFGIDPRRPFLLLIQHPTPTLSLRDSGREMASVLDGVLALGVPVFCSYPNADPGNVAIREAIDTRCKRDPLLRAYHNLPRSQFVSLYRRCAAIVGNSSSLVIESGFLKKPAVLVGPRQDYRVRGANVARVPIEAKAVARACRRALEDRAYLKLVKASASPYGDGRSGGRIAGILARVDLSPDLLLKGMSY